MRFIKKQYQLEWNEKDNYIELYNSKGEYLFKFPFFAELYTGNNNLTDLDGGKYIADNNVITYRKNFISGDLEEISFSLVLNEDDIIVSFDSKARNDIKIYEVDYFKKATKGLEMTRCVRNFTPQPRCLNGVNRSLYGMGCDDTMDGYFTPAPLNFTLGNKGWSVSFGLLDLPDSYEYGLSKFCGILVEKPCGHKVVNAGETYIAPRVIITFPENEWEGLSLFREKLIEYKAYSPKAIEDKNYYEWWKKPMVVTYGDQMMELQYNGSDYDYDSPGFTEEWLNMWLDRARNRLKVNDFTIVVDAFWQHRYSSEGKVNPATFKNLRAFIDKCHDLGHRVLLWVAPLIDNVNNGFITTSQQFDVLTNQKAIGVYPEETVYSIDFSADNIGDYLKEISRQFFSDEPDALNCDGLKMDYLAFFHNPAKSEYRNAKNGIGVKEMYRFYKTFLEKAREIKPDVLLNGSACEPRFEEVLCMNRLHDIQLYYPEREDRARISSLSAPTILIDSDGASMYSDWIYKTYISAVVYGVPALYYIKELHDRDSLTDDKMEQLGKLLTLSSKKPWGIPVYHSYGNWTWESNGKIYAQAIDENRVVVLDGKGVGYLFTWTEGMNKFPTLNRKILKLPEEFKVEENQITGNLKAGTIYTFTYEE